MKEERLEQERAAQRKKEAEAKRKAEVRCQMSSNECLTCMHLLLHCLGRHASRSPSRRTRMFLYALPSAGHAGLHDLLMVVMERTILDEPVFCHKLRKGQRGFTTSSNFSMD